MQATVAMTVRQGAVVDVYRAGKGPGEAARAVVDAGLATDAYDAQSAVFDAWWALRENHTTAHVLYDADWREPWKAVLAVMLKTAFADVRAGAPCLRRLNRAVSAQLGYPRLVNHRCGDRLHFCARDAYEWLTGEWAIGITKELGRDVGQYLRLADEALQEGQSRFRWCMFH